MPQLTSEYIDRMEDLLKLYEKPHNTSEPVICYDEKPVQLLADIHEVRNIRVPGQTVLRDYEYKRMGTGVILVGVEPRAGRRMTEVRARRTANDFAEFIHGISQAYRRAKKIHLVFDNLNTHCLKSMIGRYGEKKGKKIWDRFQIHPTPKHASWLNQAEIEINVLAGQCLGRRRISDLQRLGEEVQQWTRYRNQKRAVIEWGFTKRKARKVFKY